MTDQSSPLELPDELDGWNWGAFLLNWIWGIGNNTFIALLALVPGVGLIMIFVLGAKGNRWAWQNGRWDSIEHFKRVQRARAKWAVIFYIAVAALFAAIFGGAFYALSHSEAYRLAVSKLEVSAEVGNLIGAPISTGWPTGSLKTDGAGGSAALEFSVTGPKGAGRAVRPSRTDDGR